MSPRKKQKNEINFRRGFKLQTSDKILKVISHDKGNKTLNKSLQKLVKIFPAIPKPTDELDWLAQFNEPGQDCIDFKSTCPIKKSEIGTKKFIYYVQIGQFNVDIKFSDLIDYSQLFFSKQSIKYLDDKIEIKRVDNPKAQFGFDLYAYYENFNKKLKFRYDSSSQKLQILVTTIHNLLYSIRPKDACCLLGLTEFDLYVDESDLFVAGLANPIKSVAAFSFMRYNPNLRYSDEFWHDLSFKKSKKTDNSLTVILNRASKLLVHETLHLLGFDHCIYMDCCMNGSGHLQEDFRQSMFLCPVDLKKLSFLFEFKPIERYELLRNFFLKHQSENEINWLNKSIALLGNE